MSTKSFMIVSARSLHPLIVAAVLVAVGACGGYFVARQQQGNAVLENLYPIREQSERYAFINPLLSYEIPEGNIVEEYAVLEQRLQRTIDEKKKDGSVDEMGFYFRDLTAGRWVGIGENIPFEPASLFKVPVLIAYLRHAQSEPAILEQRIAYTASIGANTEFLTPGEEYTVYELLESMIINSDNTALNLLMAHIDSNSLNEIFSDLGIEYPTEATDYVISVKKYSLFFRVLFNSTYLNRDMSERALHLLSRTTFTTGIVAGLPDDVIVSHKFGKRDLYENDEFVGTELHDCGFVYYPQHPYLVCIFTRGKQLEGLTDTIRMLSEMTYDEMRNQYGD